MEPSPSGGMSHSDLWAFIRLGDGNPGEAFEDRWVAECMAGGDIVIPYLSQPLDPDAPYRRGREDNSRYLSFAIFQAGAPPEGVEPVLRSSLQQPGLTPAEIDVAVQTYRAMYAPD
ncbi:MAG: hypothetical protein KIT43_10480 [Bauldia sp.]|nr:hypothetical protein [Bauldia sp.]